MYFISLICFFCNSLFSNNIEDKIQVEMKEYYKSNEKLIVKIINNDSVDYSISMGIQIFIDSNWYNLTNTENKISGLYFDLNGNSVFELNFDLNNLFLNLVIDYQGNLENKTIYFTTNNEKKIIKLRVIYTLKEVKEKYRSKEKFSGDYYIGHLIIREFLYEDN